MPTPSTARMHDFEVVSNQEIAEGIFSLVISAPKLASALKPGQFVNIAVPGDASSLLRVPLSFYRADAHRRAVVHRRGRRHPPSVADGLWFHF